MRYTKSIVNKERMTELFIYQKVKLMLEEVPGQSVKELATKLKVSRNILSGYLQALEDLGHVSSRQVGPARVYYNDKRGAKDAT